MSYKWARRIWFFNAAVWAGLAIIAVSDVALLVSMACLLTWHLWPDLDKK